MFLRRSGLTVDGGGSAGGRGGVVKVIDLREAAVHDQLISGGVHMRRALTAKTTLRVRRLLVMRGGGSGCGSKKRGCLLLLVALHRLWLKNEK